MVSPCSPSLGLATKLLLHVKLTYYTLLYLLDHAGHLTRKNGLGPQSMLVRNLVILKIGALLAQLKK